MKKNKLKLWLKLTLATLLIQGIGWGIGLFVNICYLSMYRQFTMLPAYLLALCVFVITITSLILWSADE